MEYLDQILAHMEAPHLNSVDVTFLDPPIFDTSRISSCIGHMETFEVLNQAYVYFRNANLNGMLSSRKGTTSSKVLTLSL